MQIQSTLHIHTQYTQSRGCVGTDGEACVCVFAGHAVSRRVSEV